MKSKSIYIFFFHLIIVHVNIRNSIGKDPNYDLITPNGIIRHFIVFIEVEELGIPVGITRSERVTFSFYLLFISFLAKKVDQLRIVCFVSSGCLETDSRVLFSDICETDIR